MPNVVSSRWAALLLLFLLAATANAITPWTLLINTNNALNVTNYGANVTNADNAAAIQSAITAAARAGRTNGLVGGVIEIPAGTNAYLCGPLSFSNNVDLQLDAGAILQMLPYGTYPGAPYTTTPPHFINGQGLTNIAITGLGTIDGQGSNWWVNYKTISRPNLINFPQCSKVLLQDFTSSNPPAAHIVVKGANAGGINLIGIHLYAPASTDPVNPSHNTDGVDFAQTNALFQNCVISTGDDNIAIGSSASVSTDILVTNCFFGEGHGVSIGSFTSGGVSNLTVISCSFSNTGNGINLKSQRDRGGVVQNLNYYNLTMTNVDTAVSMLCYYEWGLGTITKLTPQFVANYYYTNANPTPYKPPVYRNITISNITANLSTDGRVPFLLCGLPDSPVSNVVFKAVTVTANSVNNPQIYNATNIQFIDCSWKLPAADMMQFWDANATFTNSVVSTNQLILDGLTTNGIGNSLAFYNATASLKNTNMLDDGPLTLGGGTFTVSNNLTLAPAAVLNFQLRTNATTLVVRGNLVLGGTNNIAAGPDFTNGTYRLATYTGTLSGSYPVLGSVPAGYNYALTTNTPGQLNLVVTVLSPTNLVAMPTNLVINLKWNAVNGATNYNLKRGTVSGDYPTIYSGVEATNYADATVTNAVKYFYVVSAMGAGGESTNSSETSATPLPSNAPTNLVSQFSGGQMELSWPQDHLGWRLLIQTNGLDAGLSTNWVTVPNSTNVMATNIPIVLTNGSVFLRLVYP